MSKTLFIAFVANRVTSPKIALFSDFNPHCATTTLHHSPKNSLPTWLCSLGLKVPSPRVAVHHALPEGIMHRTRNADHSILINNRLVLGSSTPKPPPSLLRKNVFYHPDEGTSIYKHITYSWFSRVIGNILQCSLLSDCRQPQFTQSNFAEKPLLK